MTWFLKILSLWRKVGFRRRIFMRKKLLVILTKVVILGKIRLIVRSVLMSLSEMRKSPKLSLIFRRS